MVFCALLLVGAPVRAEQAKRPTDPTEAPLTTFSAQDRAILSPYLDHGPVMLTEFRRFPAVIYAARVNAPASTVRRVIAEPKTYPKFMPSLDSVKVQSRQNGMVAYKWAWKIVMFTLEGSNVMHVSPTPTDVSRGYRIDVRNTGGDLGRGRMVWRIYPEGPKQSMVVFGSRIDMRKSNYITEQLAEGGSAINSSINISLAAVMLLSTKSEAERLAGTSKAQHAGLKPLHRPDIDIAALSSLMRRGDLVFMDLEGDTLHQIAVVGRSGGRLAQIRKVMVDPEEFGESLLFGSRAKIVERSPKLVRFDWGIPLPLIGVGGQMLLRPSAKVVAVDGVSGSFSDSQWRFDTHPMLRGEAAVIGWAQFDPSDSVKLIERLIAGNAYFSHGLSAAMQLMIVRSLRARVRYNRYASRR